ncbi:MAG: hypothetical protein JXI43_10960 [Tissierellales bacterium]|nr:hypothetical protein [Tissierellales bacterium]
MKGDSVPDNNHITRFCFRKHISDEQIQPSAFLLRESEEYLSVNWLEYLNCACREQEINKIRSIYKSNLTIKPRDKIALFNVGRVKYEVFNKSEDNRKLEILHNPIVNSNINDPSHCGIYNLYQDDMMIAQLIRETIDEIYSAC